MSVEAQGQWSSSVQSALVWASGCASLRRAQLGLGPEDMLLGLLLAHPDQDGEVWRLLEHFGLTARDMLPDEYPIIDAAALARAAAGAQEPSPDHWGADMARVMSEASSLARGGPTQVLHALAALLKLDLVQDRLQAGLDRFGFSAHVVADRLALEALPTMDLGGPTPAGTQLGAWLAQSFPRRPATMASFSNDETDPGADFIGIAEEADAFAYLIASRNLVPPLAIGLFGDWGSGKSFLMAKIRQRIGQLTALAAANHGTHGIWPNVAAVDFNAWQYVETDLWAALLSRIFDQLSPQARDELTRLADRRHEATRDREKVESEIARLRAQEARQVGELAAAEAETDRIKEQTAGIRATTMRTALEDHARSTATAGLVGVLGESLGHTVLEAASNVEMLQSAAKAPVWRQREFWSIRRVIWIMVAFFASGAVAILLDQVSSSTPAAFAALAAGAAVLAPILRVAATFADGQRSAAELAQKALEEQLATVTKSAEDLLSEKQEALTKTRVQLAEQFAQERRITAEQVDLNEMAARLQAGAAYTDFLQSRGSTDDYRKRLGVVSTVSDDLRTLSELVGEYNRDPDAWTAGGPPNRIVLYIDDLDRCPPPRVLEVLEAVHLLLAFPLFVVVVAVDTRWLTTALHEALPTLQRYVTPDVAAPTATDYLEKIFQIPFWVEPLDETARRRLLRGLLLPSVEVSETTRPEKPGVAVQVGDRERRAADTMLARHGQWLDLDAHASTISPSELEFMERLTPLTTGTPRQVKRFVNICRLLLAMSPPLESGPGVTTERTVACLMAALHQSMPALACRLAESARQALAVRATGAGATLETLLADLVDPVVSSERSRLQNWLAAQPPPPAMPFGNPTAVMLLRRWDTIKRLRFGEAATP